MNLAGPAAERVLLVASFNPGKCRELERLLAGHGYTLESLQDHADVTEVPEDGTTFEANARTKALTYARQTGRLCVADDSGLEVHALEGAPGVYSARFAGPDATDADNNQRLLQELAEVPDDQRQARFVCVAVLADPTGVRQVARGETTGRILRQRQGDHGFGYDPLFLSDDLGIPFGEATPEAKDQVSHRGRALRALLPALLDPRTCS